MNCWLNQTKSNCLLKKYLEYLDKILNIEDIGWCSFFFKNPYYLLSKYSFALHSVNFLFKNATYVGIFADIDRYIAWDSSIWTQKSFQQGLPIIIVGHSFVISLFTVHSLWGKTVFLSKRRRKNSYSLCYMKITFMYSLSLQKPRAWNMSAIQIWFQSIVQTKDFVCVMYCLVLLSFQTTFKCMHICFW